MCIRDSRRYDVGYGVKTLDDLHAVIAFFEERRGRLYGFRFKDFADFKSCAPQATIAPTDQKIAVGDGTTRTFQLVKTYTSGTASWIRTIKKPVIAKAAINGTETTAFTLDTTTGQIVFTTAPAAAAAITAGFEFDTPVRFDTDSLSVNLSSFAAGEIPSIPIVEVAI